MKGTGAAACLTAAALLAGCSTNYVPRSPARLSIVMQGGNIAYQRDGRVYPDTLGGGLVEAVTDDREAREAAETYFHRNVGGLVATGVGVLCLIGGVSALAVNQPPSSERQGLAGGALICALAGEITGLVLLTTAQPYQLDAINIYNDHAEERLRAPRYVYPPPGFAPPGPPLSPPPGAPPAPGSAPPAAPAPPASAPPAGSSAPAGSSVPAPGTSAAAPGVGAAAPASSASLPPAPARP